MKEGRGTLHTNTRRGCYAGQLAARQFNIDSKSGPQKRAGRNTGTHTGGSSEGTKKKRAAAKAAAVTEHEWQRRRRPLHGYMQRGVAKKAAVTGSGRRRCRRPLQKVGGGRYRGRHRKRAAAEKAAVK
jgi:hypothetical protein